MERSHNNYNITRNVASIVAKFELKRRKGHRFLVTLRLAYSMFLILIPKLLEVLSLSPRCA